MIVVRAVACPVVRPGGLKYKACPVLPRSRIQQARTTCWAYHDSPPFSTFIESDQRMWYPDDYTDYDIPSNGVPSLGPGGQTLRRNKERLNEQMGDPAFDLSDERKHLLMAMAMQETNHMDVRERDASKDRTTNKSKNATCFNLSQDLIEKSGWFAGRPGQYKDMTDYEWQLLNSDAGLRDAVGILTFAFDAWDVEDTLAFVRHGGDAFDPTDRSHPRPAGEKGWWTKYVEYKPYDQQYRERVKAKVFEYFGCIKLMLHCIDDHPELMHNNMRPKVFCSHLDEPVTTSRR